MPQGSIKFSDVFLLRLMGVYVWLLEMMEVCRKSTPPMRMTKMRLEMQSLWKRESPSCAR